MVENGLLELYNRGDFQEVVTTYDQLDLPSTQNAFYYYKALIKLDQLDEAISGLQSTLSSEDDLKPIFELKLIHELIRSYHKKGEYKEITNRVESGMKVIDQLDQEDLTNDELRVLGSFFNTAGISHYIIGDYTPAKHYYNEVLQLADEINEDSLRLGATINLGLIHQEQGRYQTALDKLHAGLELARSLDNSTYIRVASSNLGQLYNIIGSLDEAKKYTKTAIKISKEDSNRWGMAMGYTTMGRIHYKQEHFAQALEYLDDSIELKNQFDNEYELTRSYFFKLLVNLQQNDRTQARTNLRQMRQFAEGEDTERIEIYYQIGEALYLRYSTLYKHKISAEQKLREVIFEDIEIEADIILLAFFNLIELLLEQVTAQTNLELDEEEELLDDVTNLYQRLEVITEDQSTPWLDIQLAYIRAHLDVIQMKFTKAWQNLKNAEQIAENSGIKLSLISEPEISSVSRSDIATIQLDLRQSVDKLIHTLPRLKIMVTLSNEGRLPFSELQEVVGLTAGNLSNHCGRLMEAGYITKKKEIVGDKFTTVYMLTPEGLSAFDRYRSILHSHLR